MSSSPDLTRLASGPLGLDPMLLEILACPDTHHSPLTVDEAASELLCTTCDRAFPVRDGIPVLLLDEATPGPNGLGKPANPA
jgi:uncharacterized protein